MISENHQFLKRGIEIGMSVSELEAYGLSARVINALEEGGIVTLKDLLYTTENRLLRMRQIGVTAVKQIRKAVLAIGM